MFDDRMYTEAIPERVYVLCKLLEKESLSSDEAREKMEPQFFKKADIKLKLLIFNDI